MAQKRKPELVEGYVESDVVLKGTASQHEGVVLTTDQGEKLRLQRIGGNPFSDEVTKSLVGQRVRLEGYRLGSVFRFDKQEPAPES